MIVCGHNGCAPILGKVVYAYFSIKFRAVLRDEQGGIPNCCENHCWTVGNGLVELSDPQGNSDRPIRARSACHLAI